MNDSLKLTQIAALLLAAGLASPGCSDDSSPSMSSPPADDGAEAEPSGDGDTMMESDAMDMDGMESTDTGETPTDMSDTEEGVSDDIPLASQQVPDGWATVWPGEDDRVTNGGGDADPDHIFTVTNRTELVQALYPDAVIADDGSFATENGADDTPKIIYVHEHERRRRRAHARGLRV